MTKRKTDRKKVNEMKVKQTAFVQNIPTLEDVQAYFEINGYCKEAAKQAFLHYEATDWKDVNGNLILSWKKNVTGWMTKDNKSTAQKKKENPYHFL